MLQVAQNTIAHLVRPCLLLMLLSACTGQADLPQPPPTRPHPASTVKSEVTIAAVGDIMMPLSIQKAVAANGHHYDLLFERIAPDLQSADIAFANLETQVDHEAPVSGYPQFNAHPKLLSAIKEAGIDIVSVANNHALDRGPAGLTRTLDNITAAGIRFAGAGRTIAEGGQAVLLSAGTITAAFLAYTYDTNAGMPRKIINPPILNILRSGSEADLARAAASVRKVRPTADLVIVSLHWGNEYSTKPTAWQRRVAAELIDEGADVILGHHPHVLQPIESYPARDGRVGLIAFSLGNFISSQNYGVTNRNRAHDRARRGDSVILMLYAKKEAGGTSITRAVFQPLWTNREKVGASAVFRPVVNAVEISRLESLTSRTSEDEGLIALLRYRQQFITEQLIGKQVK